MRVSNLRTAQAIAEEHGQGIIVVIGGVEWELQTLTVVERPHELALCDGYTEGGDLVLFDAESIDLVRIPPKPDGKRAALRKYRGSGRR